MSGLTFNFTAKQLVADGRLAQEDIDRMKAWLPTQKCPQLTDEQIALFLLSCQGDQEATKRTLTAYYSIRNKSPKLFTNRDMEETVLKGQTNTYSIAVMPERTDDGEVIIFVNLLDTNYANFNFEIYMKYLFMTLDGILLDDPPSGLILVYDMKGVGLMHLTIFKLGLLSTFCRYLQEALPLCLKKAHVLNTVYFVDTVMALFKPFLSQRLYELIQFHHTNMDMEEFYKQCIPKKCLPQELGGALPAVSELHAENIGRLKEIQGYFDAEEEQRQRVN